MLLLADGFTTTYANWEITSGASQATFGIDGLHIAAPTFRMRTRRYDFLDVSVEAAFKVEPQPGGNDWDGVHFLLRYQSEENLYAISVNRRDNVVLFKRKDLGGPSNGGTYVTLGKPQPYVVPVGQWQAVEVGVSNGSLGVRLWMTVSGDMYFITDTSPQAITKPGKVALRTDSFTTDVRGMVIRAA
jgi:hypothetical protein